MKVERLLIVICICFFFKNFLFGQNSSIFQLSGVISTQYDNELFPVSYCGVYLKNAKSGVSSNEKGLFSLPANSQDTLIISHVSFEQLIIPLQTIEIKDKKGIILVELTPKAVLVPEVVIYPWPRKEFFEIEFVHMKLNDSLQHLADNNLSESVLDEIALNMTMDGKENATLHMRSVAKSYYSIGQDPYIALFDVIAWGKFIQELKKGKVFKKE